MEGETNRCGMSWSLSHSSYISTGWSENKQMEGQKVGTAVELHLSVLSSSDSTKFRFCGETCSDLMLTELQDSFSKVCISVR